jgi:predicted nucleic-acid-binding Zn-ribbon protein
MNERISQAASKPCPECGGQRVIAKYSAAYTNIPTGMLTSTATIPVSCTNCGYTTLYTEDPNKVRKHYLK